MMQRDAVEGTQADLDALQSTETREAFIESLYDTLTDAISPTPMYEVTEGDIVDVAYLNGEGTLPSDDAFEVTALDLTVAALFFDDAHMLYEGETGVGKTYVSEAVFNTIFGPDNYYAMRLSGGLVGTSVLSPYTEMPMDESGAFTPELDEDKVDRYGGMFIDEVNRGESDELTQLLDGKVEVNDETGQIRIPVPGTENEPDGPRYKHVSHIAAMNPATADYNEAMNMDDAVANRFLTSQFPNAAVEAGTGQLHTDDPENLHEAFWQVFQNQTGIDRDWKEVFPAVAETANIKQPMTGKMEEYIDATLGYFVDPRSTYDRNTDLTQDVGYTPEFTLRDDDSLQRIEDVIDTIDEAFGRRDIEKINAMGQVLGFIKGMKRGTYENETTLTDMAAATGMVLEAKTRPDVEYGNIIPLVNDARSAYRSVTDQFDRDLPGDLDLDEYGVRQGVWTAAVYNGREEGKTGYDAVIQHGIDTLNAPTGDAAEALIRSRLVSDLAVLEHFGDRYADEIETALAYDDADETFDAFADLYDDVKDDASVYEHRLETTFGG